MISPDGRWAAYESDESGRPEIYVTGFPSAGGKWQISIAGGSLARWRRDGREMFYLAPDNTLMSVKVNASAGQFAVDAPVALFHTTASPGPAYPYDVSPDGERFIISDARVVDRAAVADDRVQLAGVAQADIEVDRWPLSSIAERSCLPGSVSRSGRPTLLEPAAAWRCARQGGGRDKDAVDAW